MTAVKLAGKEYDIPVLAIKQIREIDWRFMRSAQALRSRKELTAEAREDIFDIVYHALTATQPDLTREQFDALNIGLFDAYNAVPTIIEQTNMFTKQAEEATPQTGEAQASGTGTP